MAVLGPVVFYLGWPWLWSDPWQRLAGYAAFHLQHDYYNMEFLGTTHYAPPMPRLYAWLMTVATVPLTTLFLAGVGVARALRVALRARLLPGAARWLGKAVRAPGRRIVRRHDVHVLWGLCLLAGYAPWWSVDTPIFGGTKHWLPAYPFLALFAGLGVDWVQRQLAGVVGGSPRLARALPMAGCAVVALPGLVITSDSHPFGLSAYTPLVGGAPGAASLGLNRTFWGYSTGSLSEAINRDTAGGAKLYLHDTARSSFQAMQQDRRIRDDVRGTLDISASDYALYHHEPHMRRVEYQIWVDYGTLTPSNVATFHGVPVAWLYERPD
jgi:hypothetical protein